MVQKWPFILTLFLGNIGKQNVFHDIQEQKKTFLGFENKKFKKSNNWKFSKGVNSSFWSKNGHFSKLFFLGNIGRENVFRDILEQKKVFLGYRNKKFKKAENWHFSKGIKTWSWSKNGHFSKVYFLGNIGQENIFHDILQRKNSFLGYKKRKLKKSKNWHFSKGVNPWFTSKNGHFSKLFFFRQYRPGNCLSRYSRTKKTLSRL